MAKASYEFHDNPRYVLTLDFSPEEWEEVCVLARRTPTGFTRLPLLKNLLGPISKLFEGEIYRFPENPYRDSFSSAFNAFNDNEDRKGESD